MILLRFLCLLALLALPARAEDIPRDAGLPVAVQVGLAFAALHGFDENAGSFDATIDLRLRWKDSRLARKDGNLSAPPLTLRDSEAAAQGAHMWMPEILIANQVGEAEQAETGLRLFSDGTVEELRRIRANFSAEADLSRFPFDRQKLSVEIVSRNASVNEVALITTQSDIDFSRVARDADLPGWRMGTVDLRSAPVTGWYNTTSARIVASMDLIRQPGLVVASIFIPLIASLLIPLLAIWLNRMEDGVFQVDTFELVNIIIGGFFAVIALNFTVLSTYPALASGDNTVIQLLALNYMTLAAALLVSILFGRFNVAAKVFGVYVQEQAYHLVMWAGPVCLLILVAAIMLNAYV